jgi:predicted glutamine amidotransferase
MCGLFGGLSTTLSTGEVEKVCQLGYVSALRGTDSTGIAFGYRKKDRKFGVYTHKLTEAPADYFRDDSTVDLLKKIHPMFMIGHTRAATIGDVNVENAHPHQAEHIIGTHNGTISTFGNASKSDSRVLFERLAKEGVSKAFSAADSGAYATVFADVRARTVNFFRNGKRPLWLMWDKNKQLLLWASEWGFLQMVADHSGYNGNFQDPFELPVHTLLHVPFGEKITTSVKIKIDTPSWLGSGTGSVESRFPNLTRKIEPADNRFTQGPPGVGSTVPLIGAPKGVTPISDKPSTLVKVIRKDGTVEYVSQAEIVAAARAADSKSASDPNWGDPAFSSALMEEDKECPLPSFVTRDGNGNADLHKTEYASLVTINGGGRYDKEYYMCTDRLIIPTIEAEMVLDIGCHGCGVACKLSDEDVEWYSTDTFLCGDCKKDHFLDLFAMGHIKRRGTGEVVTG